MALVELLSQKEQFHEKKFDLMRKSLQQKLFVKKSKQNDGLNFFWNYVACFDDYIERQAYSKFRMVPYSLLERGSLPRLGEYCQRKSVTGKFVKFYFRKRVNTRAETKGYAILTRSISVMPEISKLETIRKVNRSANHEGYTIPTRRA